MNYAGLARLASPNQPAKTSLQGRLSRPKSRNFYSKRSRALCCGWVDLAEFFSRIFDQFNFLDWIFGRKSGPLFSGSGSKGKSWPKKCLFFCKAQQKIKKLSKKCLFDCKAQQKTKNCQKSVPGGVFYPVVFFNSVHPVSKVTSKNSGATTRITIDSGIANKSI